MTIGTYSVNGWRRGTPPATMTGMEVRPARPSDARAIAEVHVRSWQVAYVGQVPDDYLASLSADHREPVWREILGATAWPTIGALVLIEDDSVVGFTHLCPSRDPGAPPGTGEVTSIYLAPEVWSRGGGRLLMRRAVGRLQTAGFTAATLWVLDTNQRARRFYEAAGWSADGAVRVAARWGFPLRELRYGRSLL